MGKYWDGTGVWLTEVFWRECLRVLKPGGHAVVWSLPRTSFYTAMALQQAGFEIRDCVYHIFGQGFPKSLNVSKAIDKMAGVEREVIGTKLGKGGENLNQLSRPDGRDTETAKGCGAYGTGAKQVDVEIPVTAPATPEAQQWEGWGTALKPAVEAWWLCRKPIVAQNVAAQVLATGTGAINIDGCRIATGDNLNGGAYAEDGTDRYDGYENWRFKRQGGAGEYQQPKGRWPSHLVLSHAPGCKRVGEKQVKSAPLVQFTDGMKPFGNAVGHPYAKTPTGDADGMETVPIWDCAEGCPVKELDGQSGNRPSTGEYPSGAKSESNYRPQQGAYQGQGQLYSDSGGASRFFQQFLYCPKASSSEKNEGLDDLPAEAQHKLSEQTSSTQSNRRCLKCGLVKFGQPHCECEEPEWAETEGSKVKNSHPTVKPLTLMKYLCRLVTPPGGIVLDPFAGSGSTLVAAVEEGFKFLGIEREDEYITIAQARLAGVIDEAAQRQAKQAAFDFLADLPAEGED